MQRKRIITGTILVALAVGGTTVACSPSQNSGVQNDQAVSNSILDRLQKNQPIPATDFSQYRQTIIDVENAEIHGVATTSFFYNQGVKDPIFTCPSIGFPVAATSQLTNPQQVIYTNHPNGGNDASVVAQLEPNGTYTGDSTGTYVECVAGDGTKYAKYWEGFVDTIGGPAHWNGSQEVLDGAPTVTSKKK